MNATVKPLDNVDVREALRTAVDYDGIVKNLFSGNAKKVQGIIPAGLAGHNPATPFQADVAKAKALLTKAGQTAITLELPRSDRAGPGWRRLGRPRGETEGRLVEDRRHGEHQADDAG
jgi:peptide/nickel transport system substrate-binding protein